MRLLLVEDDELLGNGVQVGLQQAGYTIDWLKDGSSASSAIKTNQFDLIILDLGLPHIDGIDIVKSLRTNKDDTPVLILTARDSLEDRITGLDSGADDYLTKPFDLDELNARIRALLRRRHGHTQTVLSIRDITLDPASHKVTKNGENVTLSASEFALFHYLLENINRVISRNKLEETIYGWSGDKESNSLEVFIHHLRKKLGNDLIRTIRGIGYIIEQ